MSSVPVCASHCIRPIANKASGTAGNVATRARRNKSHFVSPIANGLDASVLMCAYRFAHWRNLLGLSALGWTKRNARRQLIERSADKGGTSVPVGASHCVRPRTDEAGGRYVTP